MDNIKINNSSSSNIIHLNDNFPNKGGISVNIKGNHNLVELIGNCQIQGNLTINIIANHSVVSLNSVSVTKNLTISILPAGGGLPSSYYSVTVGEGTIFNGNTNFVLAETNNDCHVGKGCLFANNITLKTSDSHFIYDVNSNTRLNIARSINISDNVWICENVSILKGASIGKDSVIGCNSVVSRHFDASNVIIAGNPAKIVKENIYWKVAPNR